LFEKVVAGEGGEGNFGGKEVGFEYISLLRGFGNVDLPASIMLGGRANVPTDHTMFAEGCASVGSNVGDDASAWWSNGCPIEVVVAEH
jgi:hypothetical protein